MRLIKFILLLAAILLGSSVPNQANATKDSSFYRHRISVLPTQLVLQEFSLFYEFSITKLMAIEVSGGYQGNGPAWASQPFNILDPDIDLSSMNFNGITARANFKVFLPQIDPMLYIAPMGLFKLHTADSRFSIDRGGPNERQDISIEARRTSIGMYGLAGFRTRGSLFVDFYAGAGLRYFQDRRKRDMTVNGTFMESRVWGDPEIFPDIKLGFKVGVVLL